MDKYREEQIEYWRGREATAQAQYIKDEKKYARVLKGYYADMFDKIEAEIDTFIGRYAESEGISVAEAMKRVDRLDIEEYERKAEKYVKNKDLSPQANAEMKLYNLTMKVNRLEMLKARIGLALIEGFDKVDSQLGTYLQDRTKAELERQSGILGATVRHNEKLAREIVNSSFKGATYSQRVWANEAQLKMDLEKLLTQGMVSGRNPKELARYLRRNLRDLKTRTVYNTERIMRTEMTKCQIDAFRRTAEEQGYTQYIYVACHKLDCCEICKELDGKVYKLSEMVIGDNAPPMHPNCHCATARYYDRKEWDEWMAEHGF